MIRLTLAVSALALAWNQRRLWKEMRRLDRFTVTAQLRNFDQFNRIEARLPSFTQRG
jgi:hypothetical protein